MNGNTKPQMTLFLAYSAFRERMTAYLNKAIGDIPIPAFMVESVLSGMLADIRAKVITDLSGEHNLYEQKIEEYLKKEADENGEQVNK